MKIRVNGEEKKIELDQENALLSSALKHMGYKPNTIVVELNNLIVNSMKWEQNGELAQKDLYELIERLKNVESENTSSELTRLGTKLKIKD